MDAGATTTGLSALLTKLLGSGAGAFLALVLIPPKNVKEALSRSSVSLVSGVIFSPLAMDYFTWGSASERSIASGTLAAMVSWWGLGAIIKVARARIASRASDKADEVR